MTSIASILICLAIAFWGNKRQLKFITVLLIGMFLTPVASLAYVLLCGYLNVKIRHPVLLVFLVCIIESFLFIQFVSHADNTFPNSMKELDYSSATGTKIVTYFADKKEYSLDYIPDELTAHNKNDIGYVLEVSSEFNQAEYTGGHVVDGEVLHASLIDCDTGKLIAKKTFGIVFPDKILSNTYEITVPKKEVSDWVISVFPQ